MIALSSPSAHTGDIEDGTRFSADQWKQRALDAERQRDQAERELGEVRGAIKELLERLDVFLFAASFRDDDAAAQAVGVRELDPVPREAEVSAAAALDVALGALTDSALGN